MQEDQKVVAVLHLARLVVHGIRVKIMGQKPKKPKKLFGIAGIVRHSLV